jgi:hypothetical protein
MATGEHWEWRGFGTLTPDVRRQVEALKKQFGPRDQGRTEADLYLWTPACTTNLKIRVDGTLKVKRHMRSEPDGVEQWLEDPREVFAFPLDHGALAALERDLQTSLPADVWSEVPIDVPRLLTHALPRAVPAVESVCISKHRLQRIWRAAGKHVFVEHATVRLPTRELESVALESAHADAVRQARDDLGLPDSLVVMNYMQLLAEWFAGQP